MGHPFTCKCGHQGETPDNHVQPFIKCPACNKMASVSISARSGNSTSRTTASTPTSSPASSPPSSPAARPGPGTAPRQPVPAASHADSVSSVDSGGGPNGLFGRKVYLVKERVALIKLCDTYDIFDPETEGQIGIAKEEPASWAKYGRLLMKKHFLPTVVNVYEDESQPPVITVTKGFTFLRAKLIVSNNRGTELGYFQSKWFSLGGGFYIYDMNDQQLAEVAGDWKGWNFTFKGANGKEYGQVTKKWAGIGKELFTSADNYVISMGDVGTGKARDALTTLLLAAGICIDVVFKEGG